MFPFSSIFEREEPVGKRVNRCLDASKMDKGKKEHFYKNVCARIFSSKYFFSAAYLIIE